MPERLNGCYLYSLFKRDGHSAVQSDYEQSSSKIRAFQLGSKTQNKNVLESDSNGSD